MFSKEISLHTILYQKDCPGPSKDTNGSSPTQISNIMVNHFLVQEKRKIEEVDEKDDAIR